MDSFPLPIYAQMMEQIRKAIAAGGLGPGEQLPTVRQLAVELRINPNTVARVYRELEHQGLISTRQGDDPMRWPDMARVIDETNAAGGRMYGQGTTRSINAIFSLKSYLPFDVLPAWEAIRSLPLDEQKRRLRDPALMEYAGQYPAGKDDNGDEKNSSLEHKNQDRMHLKPGIA